MYCVVCFFMNKMLAPLFFWDNNAFLIHFSSKREMCYPSQKRKRVQHHSSRLYYICKCEGHLYCTVLAMLSSHPFLSTTSIATNTYSVKLLHKDTFWQELVCWIIRIMTRNIRKLIHRNWRKKWVKGKMPKAQASWKMDTNPEALKSVNLQYNMLVR